MTPYMLALSVKRLALENRTLLIMLRTCIVLATTSVACVQRPSNPETLYRSTATEIIKKTQNFKCSLWTVCLCNLSLSGNLDNVNSCIQKVDHNLFHCLKCMKQCSNRGNMVTHVENTHFPGNYPCTHCNKVFNSRNSQFVHIKRNHKDPLVQRVAAYQEQSDDWS